MVISVISSYALGNNFMGASYSASAKFYILLLTSRLGRGLLANAIRLTKVQINLG